MYIFHISDKVEALVFHIAQNITRHTFNIGVYLEVKYDISTQYWFLLDSCMATDDEILFSKRECLGLKIRSYTNRTASTLIK